MALAIANNALNRINQIGNFRELSVGAGSSVFKMITPWVWGGGTNPAAATFKIYLPTGAVTTTGTINATGGTISGDMSVSGILTLGSPSGLQVKLKGDTGEIDFLYNSGNVGKILGIASGDLAITADKDMYLTANNTTQVMRLIQNGNIELRTAGSTIGWLNEQSFTSHGSYISTSGDFVVTEGLKAKGFTVRPASTDYAGDSGTFKWMDGATEKTARVRGGIITNLNE